MQPTDTFNFSYIDLVSALGSYQADNENSSELTQAMLGFFQSEYAKKLMSDKKTNNIKLSKPKPVKPLISKFISTIHFFDNEDSRIATLDKVVEAKNIEDAQEQINSILNIGDWATKPYLI